MSEDGHTFTTYIEVPQRSLSFSLFPSFLLFSFCRTTGCVERFVAQREPRQSGDDSGEEEVARQLRHGLAFVRRNV